jgi:hypothetical protein
MQNSLKEIVELIEKIDARNEIRIQNLEDRLVRISLNHSDTDRSIKSLHEDVVAAKLIVKDLQKAVGQK